MTAVNDASGMLAEVLRPEARAPDRRFAARVRLAIVEEQRYRQARKAARRRIGSDLLVMLGLLGPALGIAQLVDADGSLRGAVPALFIAALVVGGWIMISGEARRFQTC